MKCCYASVSIKRLLLLMLFAIGLSLILNLGLHLFFPAANPHGITGAAIAIFAAGALTCRAGSCGAKK